MSKNKVTTHPQYTPFAALTHWSSTSSNSTFLAKKYTGGKQLQKKLKPWLFLLSVTYPFAVYFFADRVSYWYLIAKLYPVLVSFSMASMFVWSIYYPPTLIERFARLTNPNLDDDVVKYTKKVTIVWASFCFLNAAVSSFTIFLDAKSWTLYNGCISYVLMGFLFILEFSYRKYLFYKKSQQKLISKNCIE